MNRLNHLNIWITFVWLFAAVLSNLSCAQRENTHLNDNSAFTAVRHEMIPLLDSDTNTIVKNTSDNPVHAAQKSNLELSQLAVHALNASMILSFPYQNVMTNPSHEHILYLMRAARYREAADYVQRTPQSDNMKFIAAKARIAAKLCTKDNPCEPEFNSISNKSKILAPVIDYWHIKAMIGDHDYQNAVQNMNAFLSSYRDVEKTRELVLDCAKSAEISGFFIPDNIKILEKLKLLISNVHKNANAFEAASLTYFLMNIEYAANHLKNAEQKKKQLVLRYPATQMSLWPELADEMLPTFSVSEKMSRIQRLISHFDYDNARHELAQIVDDKNVAQNTRDKAEWMLAKVSMTNSEDPQLSERIYRKWAKKSGPLREEAVFGIARSLSRQLKYPEAIKALENYDRLYPRGKYHSRSLYLRGWYLFDLRQNDSARPLLLEYAKKTNDTSVWGFYAQTFIRDQMWKEAINAFEHIKRNKNPIVRGKALYWQAYAEHALQNDDAAAKRLAEIHREFPLTWYDMLAYQREEDWFGINADNAFRKAFRRESDPKKDIVFFAWGYGSKIKAEPSSSLWKQINLLCSYDAVEEARKLYTKNESAILNSVPANERDDFRRYASHLVESYHDAWKSCSGSIRALSGTWPSRNNVRHKMAYPQPFAPLVESLAAAYGIPPYFVYGIMLQESRFRTYQVSSADAIGALQMIPKTARPIAKTLGLEYHPDTFFNPRVGFPYSIYYMKMHFEKWGHNLTFTAGSYNGGPHRIGPWALRDKGKTIDFIVDEFSFDESRHYARKVAEHTLRFAYLYAHSEDEWLDIVHQLFPRIVPDITPADDWGL